MKRRSLLAAALGGGLSTGCGFRLRQAPTLPFDSIALSGFAPNSRVERSLRLALQESGVAVRALGSTTAILQALEDSQERIAAALTVTGQLRDLQLRVRLRFRLLDAKGQEWLAPQTLALGRELSTRESAVLAKEQEEARLFAAMQQDMAQQVMRRLEALRARPAPAAPLAPT